MRNERLNKQTTEKIAAESYIAVKKRNNPKVTLTDIVEQVAQYEGFPKGKKDFSDYPRMTTDDQDRNLQRWKTAKSALEQLVQHPGQRDPFLEFRSSKGSKNPPAKGRTRIGGLQLKRAPVQSLQPPA